MTGHVARKRKKRRVRVCHRGKTPHGLQEVTADPKKKAGYDVTFDVSNDIIFVIHDITKGKADKYVNYMLQVDSTNDYAKAIVISTMALWASSGRWRMRLRCSTSSATHPS